MAFLQHDKRPGRYQFRFDFQGLEFKRSTRTKSEREAQAVPQRVNETIRLLERGRLELPAAVDPGDFNLSDGKLSKSRTSYLRSCFGSLPSLSARKRLVERVEAGIEVGLVEFCNDEFWKTFFDAGSVGFRQYLQTESVPFLR